MDSILTKIHNNCTTILSKLKLNQARLLLAVSGGRDSIAMLHILWQLKEQLGITPGIAYVNHNLRGEESLQEEIFIKETAGRFNIPLHIYWVDPSIWQNRRGESIEMTARRIRYTFFRQIMQQEHYDLVATAHHRQDLLETIIIHLLQGGGSETLRGIPMINGKTIRPMINCSRKELDHYIKEENIPFVEDSSNRDISIKRNGIRHNLLPLLNQLHPAWKTSFTHLASNLTEEYDFIHILYCRFMRNNSLYSKENGVIIKMKPFDRLHIFLQKYVIKRILRRLDWPAKPSRTLFKQICSRGNNISQRIYTNNNLLVIRGGQGRLWFIKNEDPVTYQTVCRLPDWPISASFDKYKLLVEKSDGTRPPANKSATTNTLYFNREMLPLTVSYPTEHDTIICNGKSESLKTLFKKMSIPPQVQNRSLVISVSDGTVIAVWSFGFLRVSDQIRNTIPPELLLRLIIDVRQ